MLTPNTRRLTSRWMRRRVQCPTLYPKVSTRLCHRVAMVVLTVWPVTVPAGGCTCDAARNAVASAAAIPHPRSTRPSTLPTAGISGLPASNPVKSGFTATKRANFMTARRSLRQRRTHSVSRYLGQPVECRRIGRHICINREPLREKSGSEAYAAARVRSGSAWPQPPYCGLS